MVAAILPATLEGVTVRRGARRLLGPLDWRLAGCGITVVMGPNGSGKTTLLRALHGLERIDAGRIAFAAPLDVARARQAFVFQTPVMMRRSVGDNIAYPLRLAGIARRAARDRAAAAAERVGLGPMLGRPASGLSGGERQKLALVRALIAAPELLILDEPCASLDGRATRDIEAILRQARDAGTRIVISTHDTGQARRLADEVVFLHHGHLCEHRPDGRAFFDSPAGPEAAAFLRGELLT